METLELITRALKACGDVLRWGAGLQEKTRTDLAADLQCVCDSCDSAYAAVLARLLPVKNAFADPAKLAAELRSFAADANTRNEFKPEHLCGKVDTLLFRLQSNLDPLKYSVDVTRIGELRTTFAMMGSVDAAIYSTYDEFTRHLDGIATQLQDASSDKQERLGYAQHVISDFEGELRSAMDTVRSAKNAVLQTV